MEDMLLMQILKKKGIISDRDIHEFHELAAINTNKEPVYLNEVKDIIGQNNNDLNETEAVKIVSKMYHVENGRKYIGEKFSIYTAKEICERYRGILSSNITVCDIYIAINSQYHDYSKLFKTWFGDNIDNKIIESAMVYWFMDEDCISDNKIKDYFIK